MDGISCCGALAEQPELQRDLGAFLEMEEDRDSEDEREARRRRRKEKKLKRKEALLAKREQPPTVDELHDTTTAALAAVRERLTLLEESVLDDSEDDDEKAACLEASAEVSFKPIDKLYEIANDSFYFRVSARIMHEPLRLKSFGYWLLTLLCMYLQILCLTTVWFSTWWQYANSVWYDDESEEVTEAYPAGLSYPQNWRETLKYYNTLYFGVSSVVLVPLVLCSTMLMYSVSVETKQIKASAMILYDFTSRTPTQRSCAARAAVVAKIFMCWTIFLMRVTNVWYYLDIASQLLGDSDGPINLLLNAVALQFILELDGQVLIDIPSENSFCWAKDEARIAAYIGALKDARLRLRRCVKNYHETGRLGTFCAAAVSWLSAVGTAFCIFFIGLKLQSYTNEGRFSTVDDTWPIGEDGAHQTKLTLFYNWSMYAILGLLLLDMHACLLAADADSATAAAKLAHVAGFVVEVMILVSVRVAGIQFVVQELFFYGISADNKYVAPLRFWNDVDPRPNRPEAGDYSYYGADGADAAADYYGA